MFSRRDNRIISLAWPAILGSLTYTVVSLIDMVMVGTIGPSAVAAVGLGGLFLWMAYSVMSSVSVGTTALVARYKGAGDNAASNKVMAQSLILSALLSGVIMLFGLVFGEKAIGLMGGDREVIRLGGTYIKTTFTASFFVFLAFVSESGLRGAGDTRTPMKIDLIINAVNLVLDYLLIFGRFGLPALGVYGAGLASAAAFVVGGLLHLYVLLCRRYSVALEVRSIQIDKDVLTRVLKIGVPASLERIIMSTSFTIYTGIIMAFGTLPLAATQIGIRVEAFSFMPGIGFGAAAAALVGQSLGSKDRGEAYKTALHTSKLGLIFMGFVGLLMFLFAPSIVSIFTSDPEVIGLGATYLRIVGILQPFQALLFVLAGALDGAGDTRWVLYTTLLGLLTLRLPLAYFTGVTLGLGVVAAWLSMVVDVILRSLILSWRFRSRKWMDIKV